MLTAESCCLEAHMYPLNKYTSNKKSASDELVLPSFWTRRGGGYSLIRGNGDVRPVRVCYLGLLS